MVDPVQLLRTDANTLRIMAAGVQAESPLAFQMLERAALLCEKEAAERARDAAQVAVSQIPSLGDPNMAVRSLAYRKAAVALSAAQDALNAALAKAEVPR
jgi:hypothetical protein